MKKPYKRKPIAERFWDKVKKGEACWEWTAALSPQGYGRILINGKNRLAHRFSWKIHFGEIPEGIFVCHKCDNTKCVRPDHLFLGTHTDNQRDSSNKGRHWNLKKTHCKHGHSFIEENLYYRYNGTRICKTCCKKSTAQTYRKKVLNG